MHHHVLTYRHAHVKLAPASRYGLCIDVAVARPVSWAVGGQATAPGDRGALYVFVVDLVLEVVTEDQSLMVVS